MRFNITGDTASESGVGPIIDDWSEPTWRSFQARNYGSGLLGVTVVLMCQDPELKLKRRVRLVKKEKKLYLDIMLNLNDMIQMNSERRKIVVADRIVTEVPALIQKYSPSDFDECRFADDLREWFKSLA